MVDEKTKSGTNGNQVQRVEIVNCATTEMIHLIQLVQGFLGKTLDIILLTMFSTIKSSENQIQVAYNLCKKRQNSGSEGVFFRVVFCFLGIKSDAKFTIRKTVLPHKLPCYHVNSRAWS